MASKFGTYIYSRRNYFNGFLAGFATQKSYNYIIRSIDQNNNGINGYTLSDKIYEKTKEYDTNNDDTVSPGELLDGVLKDYNKIHKEIQKNTLPPEPSIPPGRSPPEWPGRSGSSAT